MSLQNFLLLIFLLSSWTLADDSISLSMKEKIFKSYVSVYAIGNAFEAIEEKMQLEQAFKTAYIKLINEVCAFRIVEEILLDDARESNDTLVDEAYNVSESDIFLHFEITIKCFDCQNDDNLFEINYLYGEKQDAQIDIGENCYWNNNSPAALSMDNLNSTVAPSTNDFLQKFEERIQEQNISSIKEVIEIIDETNLIEEEIISCPCPKNSFCTYTNKWEKDFWRISEGLFHNCTCKDGFYGEDGWRCEFIDECETDWPCAPVDEGGYCVDTHPDDDEYPMYKCGCRPGYIPNETYPPDIHGVKNCLEDIVNSDNKTQDKEDIENSFNNTKAPPPENCSDEQLIPIYLSFNDLTIDPEAVINEKESIQRAIKNAYEGSIRSSCLLRSLQDVTMYRINYSNGTLYKNVANSVATNRYLEGSDDETFNENELTLEFNNTDMEELDDDDDDIVDDSGVNLSFNFSIFFAMIMRCYGCPEDAQLFDDASRRLLLNSQSAGDADSCYCEEDENSRSLLEFGDEISIAPTKDFFFKVLDKELKRSGVSSIQAENLNTESIKQEEKDQSFQIIIPERIATLNPTSQRSITALDTPMPTVASLNPTSLPSKVPSIETPMPTAATPVPTSYPSNAPSAATLVPTSHPSNALTTATPVSTYSLPPLPPYTVHYQQVIPTSDLLD